MNTCVGIGACHKHVSVTHVLLELIIVHKGAFSPSPLGDILLQEPVVDVAVVTSFRHADLS